MKKCDFLIIGSGIAGLSCALKLEQANPDARIVVITKAHPSESNTKYAQGGVAVVWDKLNDSYEQHIADTLRAGDGLCDLSIVETVVKEGPARLQELIAWGADFDRKSAGDLDLGLEGGHAQRRIIHHKDVTGYQIEKTLLAKVKKSPRIELLTRYFALDLITQHHLDGMHALPPQQTCCYGAYLFNRGTRKVEMCLSGMTVLASGGSGQVYQNTTNPAIATGDGVAMAYRAKARISGMEFIQFHPTALYSPMEEGHSFLISEAIRGAGALLRNSQDELFLTKYDPRGELASRDIVSRAIDSELKRSGDECVYLDCSPIDRRILDERFPNIKKKCKAIGIDLYRDRIPVAPACHYFCGGITVDAHGCTTIENLMACGECAHTGLHGANRLASNSLLEALVFAHRCAVYCTERTNALSASTPAFPPWNEKGTVRPRERVLITHNRHELQTLMSHYVGIVRSDERLKRAAKRINLLYEETEELYRKTRSSPQLFELRNLITVAYLIVQQSIARRENKGVFYNIDRVAETRQPTHKPPLEKR